MQILADVQDRMDQGYVLRAFRTPECWATLGARLPELVALARKVDQPAGRPKEAEATALFNRQTKLLDRLRWLFTGRAD